ncbi:unnamed protein product [Coregonus sp. 'balchen']|nr:unnamed protein product [Coregonus sp. 'balchen']
MDRKPIKNSRVVTVSVSNSNTTRLRQQVILTVTHLQPSDGHQHACVCWSEEKGEGSRRGCASEVEAGTLP